MANDLRRARSELNPLELDFTVKSSLSYRVVVPERIRLITPTNMPSTDDEE